MLTHKKILLQLSFALLIFLLVGSILIFADTRPRVRAIHAAPGVSNVDTYSDGTLYFENVFYAYVTNYAPLNGGEHTIRVKPAGSGSGGPNIIEAVGPYNDNQDYTVILAGRQDTPQHWRLDDDNKDLPGPGTARIRIVHASLDTPTTEFCIGDVCKTMAFKDNPEYFRLSPGVYYPEVRLNGTDFPKINIPPLHLEDNSIYTVFMIGRSQNEPRLQLIYTLDAGEPNPDGDKPVPPDTNPHAPVYPPVTGAFLSPKLMGLIAGVVLIIVGGVGYWIAQKRS